MKCPSCGAYNPEGAAFCDLCARRFGPELSASAPAAVPPQADALPGAAGRRKFSRRVYLSLIIVASVVIIGTLGYMLLSAGGQHSKPKDISVLFIGNSYTSVKNLPLAVSEISTSLGDKLTYGMSAPGGFTLRQHATYQNTISEIQSRKWDSVVLQEQSQIPAIYSDTEKARYITPYAQQLNSMIHQANASSRTVLFETWGRKNGDSEYFMRIPAVGTYSGDQALISATYEQLAAALPATLAPVGMAWSSVRQSHPGIELYQADGSHPSDEGNYLSACVFYDVLFNAPVTGASPLTIDPSQAKVLQETADQTVFPASKVSK